MRIALRPGAIMVTLTTIDICMPMQFHMPRRQPYFMPADMEERASGRGEKHSRMVVIRKVSQVLTVMAISELKNDLSFRTRLHRVRNLLLVSRKGSSRFLTAFEMTGLSG